MLLEIGDGGRIALAESAEQILGLVLELLEVGTDGKFTTGHDEPPSGAPVVRL
jgi:hypothetical protein